MNASFSHKMSEVIAYSKEEAKRLFNDYIGPEHLLLGVIRDGEGKAVEIMAALSGKLDDIKLDLEAHLRLNSKPQFVTADSYVDLNQEASRILKLCILEAKLLKSEEADTEHMLLALLRDKNSCASQVLEQHGVKYNNVFDMLKLKQDIKMNFDLPEEDEEDPADKDMSKKADEPSNASGSAQKRKLSNDTPVLDKFGIDMTKAAEEGMLDPIIGRDKEIERVAQILSRRKKNNPILIGKAGVGKSAVVEGLALRIVQKRVSRILFDKRVIAIDMASVVAGTKYRGQFEERIRSILNELQRNSNIILFIDEIHTLVGAGSASGAMDAADMLKPALARGEIQCIGATTIDEYRKYIEKDSALERRFQKIMVEPTSADETLQILINIKDRYEDHHNVTFTEKALLACVRLTGRYITDRNFPDKAIDVLDEAGSRVHLITASVPQEIEEQEKRIDELKVLKNNAVKSQNYELAASFRDQVVEMEAKLEASKKAWEEQEKEHRQVVGEAQIAEVVSMISGIPVQRMEKDENAKLLAMRSELTSRIIAQDDAVSCVVKAIQRSRVGLKDPNRPIGTFMFLGPTGVGKTHLAKELAKYMFGTSDALIRFDMSEYMEKHTVSRLIGAPPGYVGYEDGGLLTEKVHRKPYSIILFDEIEKGHADVFNLLLQIMDEGRLTDNNGTTVDFRNTIVIMTSNIGTREVKESGHGIGFNTNAQQERNRQAHDTIMKALNKSFSPEFLNRVDEIITFNQLSEEAIVRIIDLELKGVYQRIEELGYQLEVTEKAKYFIAKKGYDVQFGARPLKRAIQNHLEDPLSELILQSQLNRGDKIHADVNEAGDGIVASVVQS